MVGTPAMAWSYVFAEDQIPPQNENWPPIAREWTSYYCGLLSQYSGYEPLSVQHMCNFHHLREEMDTQKFLDTTDTLYTKFRLDISKLESNERREHVHRFTVQLRRLVLDIDDLVPDLAESFITKRRCLQSREGGKSRKRSLIFEWSPSSSLRDTAWATIVGYLQQADVLTLGQTNKKVRSICLDQRMLKIYLHKGFPPIRSNRFLIVPDTVMIESWTTIPIKVIFFDNLNDLRARVLSNIYPNACLIDLTLRVPTTFLNLERAPVYLSIGIHQLHKLRNKPPCPNVHVNCYHRPVAKVFSSFGTPLDTSSIEVVGDSETEKTSTHNLRPLSLRGKRGFDSMDVDVEKPNMPQILPPSFRALAISKAIPITECGTVESPLEVLALSCIREEDSSTPTAQVSTKRLVVNGAVNPGIVKGIKWELVRSLHFEYTTKCPRFGQFLGNLTSLSISVNTPPLYLDSRLDLIPFLLVPFLANLDAIHLRWLKIHIVWQPILADLIPLIVRFPLLSEVDIECSTYSDPYWPDILAFKNLVERRNHLPNTFMGNDDGKSLARVLFSRLHKLSIVTVGTDKFVREDGHIVFQLEWYCFLLSIRSPLEKVGRLSKWSTLSGKVCVAI